MNLSPREKESIASLVILFVVAVFYIIGINREIKRGDEIENMIVQEEASVRPFLDLALAADSFAIYDTASGEFRYKVNAERPVPLASLAKVMSAVIIMEHVPADYTFKIDKESLGEIGDNGLLVDERWSRDELLAFSLVVSSNDAMRDMAVETGKLIDPNTVDARATFVEAMNAKAHELGLRSLEFLNESGLDLENATPLRNGAYGSARDMAKLFAYATTTYPDIFRATTMAEYSSRSLDKEHMAKNTNPFVGEIPGLVASKTGFTDLAGGNLVVSVKGAPEPTVVVVLGSTFDDRFTDIKTLSGALRSDS